METKYRNTDLDLVSLKPFAGLTRALVSAGMYELGTFQNDASEWHASFEIDSDEEYRIHVTAETTIIAMLDVLEALPEAECYLLAQCKQREFNVAYDVGDAPRDFNEGMSADTIKRMAALNASLRITLYPVEE